MRHIILYSALLFSATACSEGEGFESAVSKTVEIDFELNTNSILNNGGVIEIAREHDIMSDDLVEYIGKVNDVEVHRAELSISGFNENSSLVSSVRFVDFKLRNTGDNIQTLGFFSLENLPLSGNQSMVLYHEDSTSNQQVQRAIDFVSAQILLNQPFIWDVDGELLGIPADKILTLRVSIDITATVQIL